MFNRFNRLRIFSHYQRFFDSKFMICAPQKKQLLMSANLIPKISAVNKTNFLTKRHYSQLSNQNPFLIKKQFDPKELKNNYVYLYHLIDSEERYKAILENGLYNNSELGVPIPTYLKSAEKSYDIFFHPLRENETINDLPFSSINKDQFFIAIAIPLGTKLQVNNRLYSYGAEPLHLINIDKYFKMEKYSYEGLPEVRLTVNHIPPEYFAKFGQKEKHITRYSVLPLNLENDHYRFSENSNTPRKTR